MQPILDVVYSRDGTTLLVSGVVGDRAVTVVAGAATFRTTRQYPVGGALALAPDGRTVALGDDTGVVTFLDLVTGRRAIGAGRHAGNVLGVRFSPDGRTMASVGDDADVLIWNVAARSVTETLHGHAGRVFGPAFSPDGTTLYTAGLDRTVITWDLGGRRGPIGPSRSHRTRRSAGPRHGPWRSRPTRRRWPSARPPTRSRSTTSGRCA